MSQQSLPAYPVRDTQDVEGRGLTKRELLAAMAMQGLLSGFDGEQLLKHSLSDGPPKLLAGKAVDCADALIAELEGKHE